jgi:hypothetical protein
VLVYFYSFSIISIKHCDDIIVMGHGLILERGTHEELLARPCGVYRGMWDVQSGTAGGDPYWPPRTRPSETGPTSELASTSVATTATGTDETVAASAAGGRLDVDAYSVGTGARTQIDIGTAGLLTRGLVDGMGRASSGRALKDVVGRGMEVSISDDDQQDAPDRKSS